MLGAYTISKVFVASMSVEDATNRSAFSATELKAEMAVKELGTRSLPTLLERLRLRDTTLTRFQRKIQIWATLHHISKRTRIVTPETRRRQAVTALMLLGDTAKPLLTDVIVLVETGPDRGVRASALLVLRQLSPADYEKLTGYTNSLGATAH